MVGDLNNNIYTIANSKYREQLYQSNVFHKAIQYLMYLDHIPTDEDYIQVVAECCKFADDYKNQLIDEIMK